MDCAESPLDLSLQAEIWFYTPETETWERVYQSPEDIPIPKDPSKFVARDIGFRGMTVFRKPDGTEALYVLGVNSRSWTTNEEEEVPCPRILRSTDGVNFEAVPPDPDFPPCVEDYEGAVASYRSTAIYNGRLFITAGSSLGSGIVLESDYPSAGKYSFRPVTPEGMQVWEIIPFNGYLYVGTADKEGYGIYKTTAEDGPPYEFIPVVTQGGYRRNPLSKSVVSMFVFGNKLYVGTNRPVELIRINPDDTWDLIVDRPRATPDGWKVPLSSFDSEFDWPLNVHIWRLQAHEGVLYAGTIDQSTRLLRGIPVIGKVFEKKFGFDLYGSPNGWYWTPITTNGFGNKFQMGLRTFASTPHGLFLGTYNSWGGLQIWKGKRANDITDASLGLDSPPHPPARLEAEQKDGAVLLSWSEKSDGKLFRIFRSTLKRVDKVLPKKIGKKLPDIITDETGCEVPSIQQDFYGPEPFIEIGSTDQFFYLDTDAENGQMYHYYVVAENATGQVSTPSNLVRVPSLAPAVTFYRVQKNINNLARKGIASTAYKRLFVRDLKRVRKALRGNEHQRALKILTRMQMVLAKNDVLTPWHAEDLHILVGKVIRRIQLVKEGILSASDLD